ncbi:hypothetical protein IWX49DRAFT_557434 [Phyllosticta citricarpa]
MSNSNGNGEFFMTGADNSGGPDRGSGRANMTTMETGNNSGPILQLTKRMMNFQHLVRRVVLAIDTLDEEERAMRKAKVAFDKATRAKEVAMLEVSNARLARDVALTRRERAIAQAMDAYVKLPERVQNAAVLKMSAFSSSATNGSDRVREV